MSLRRLTATLATTEDPGQEDSPLPAWLQAVFTGRQQLWHFCMFYSGLLAVVAPLVVLVLRNKQRNVTDPEMVWLWMHGVTQFMCWGLLMPLGVAVALYLRHWQGWQELHVMLMGSATVLQIPASIMAYQVIRPGGAARNTGQAWAARNTGQQLDFVVDHVPHAAYGYILIALSMTQASVGSFICGGPKIPFTDIRLDRWYRLPLKAIEALKRIHRPLGKLILLAAGGNMILGAWTMAIKDHDATRFSNPVQGLVIGIVSSWVGLFGIAFLTVNVMGKSWGLVAHYDTNAIEYHFGRMSEDSLRQTEFKDTSTLNYVRPRSFSEGAGHLHVDVDYHRWDELDGGDERESRASSYL